MSHCKGCFAWTDRCDRMTGRGVVFPDPDCPGCGHEGLERQLAEANAKIEHYQKTVSPSEENREARRALEEKLAEAQADVIGLGGQLAEALAAYQTVVRQHDDWRTQANKMSAERDAIRAKLEQARPGPWWITQGISNWSQAADWVGELQTQLAKARLALTDLAAEKARAALYGKERDALTATLEQARADIDNMDHWMNMEVTMQVDMETRTLRAKLGQVREALRELSSELRVGARELYYQKAVLACDRDWLLAKAQKAEQALAALEGVKHGDV